MNVNFGHHPHPLILENSINPKNLMNPKKNHIHQVCKINAGTPRQSINVDFLFAVSTCGIVDTFVCLREAQGNNNFPISNCTGISAYCGFKVETVFNLNRHSWGLLGPRRDASVIFLKPVCMKRPVFLLFKLSEALLGIWLIIFCHSITHEVPPKMCY